MHEGETRNKKYDPYFPVTKIKKIIQQNQEIGKLSNYVPPLIEKSLQFFLDAIIKKSQEVATEHGANKLNPAILKHALIGLNPQYEFMKDVLDDVDETIIPLVSSKSKISKRSKSQAEAKQPKQAKQTKQSKQPKQEKKGKKKKKLSDCEQSAHEAQEIED